MRSVHRKLTVGQSADRCPLDDQVNIVFFPLPYSAKFELGVVRAGNIATLWQSVDIGRAVRCVYLQNLLKKGVESW